jgi:MFS family permease
MITGRFLSGCGCGILLSVVPVYLAEVSPPKQRGFIVGLQGMMVSIGYMLANWIGYFVGWASGDTMEDASSSAHYWAPHTILWLLFHTVQSALV